PSRRTVDVVSCAHTGSGQDQANAASSHAQTTGTSSLGASRAGASGAIGLHEAQGRACALKRAPDASAGLHGASSPSVGRSPSTSCTYHMLTTTIATAASGAARIKPNAPASTPRTTCMLRRSEEHTSELQSRENLVCRLLLEKK